MFSLDPNVIEKELHRDFPIGMLLLSVRENEYVCSFTAPQSQKMEGHEKANYGRPNDFVLILDHFRVRNGDLHQFGIKGFSTEKNCVLWIYNFPLRTQFQRLG